MIIYNLIKQDWLKNFRAKGFHNNLIVNIFWGLSGLFFVIFLILGLNLGEILEGFHPTLDSFQLACGTMFYIIFGAISIRFMIQSLGLINMNYYHSLPIKRVTLINFILIKPVFGLYNYLSLLIVIPLAINTIAKYYDGALAFRFVLFFIFIIWFDLLLTSFIKRSFGLKIFTTLGLMILIFCGIFLLEFFKIFSLFDVSQAFFTNAITHPIGLLIPLCLVVIAYMLNIWFLSRNYYSETFNKTNIKIYTESGTYLTFLQRYGIIGELISLQIKLILRHKRTRSLLIAFTVFLFYGLIFYTNPMYTDSGGMNFMIAVFITGILMLMYGQWIMSWDSSHFDALLTKNISTKEYIESCYYLLMSFCIISFILTTPYFLFGADIIFMHFTALLYNLGINVFLIQFLGTFNSKRIDMSRGSAMNYQGITYKNFLFIFPIMFLPIIVVKIISIYTSYSVALWIIFIIGGLGVIFHKYLIKLCIRQFEKRKYIMAAGFRESD